MVTPYYNSKTGCLLEELVPPYLRPSCHGIKTVRGPTKKLNRVWQIAAKIFGRAVEVEVNEKRYYVRKSSWARFIAENRYLNIDPQTNIKTAILNLIQDIRQGRKALERPDSIPASSIKSPAIAMAVLWSNPSSAGLLDDTLFENPGLVEQMCAHSQLLQEASKPFVKKLIQHCANPSQIFPFLKKDVREDEEIAMAFLERDPLLFAKFSKKLRGSEPHVEYVVMRNGALFALASKKLQKSASLALKARMHGCPLSSLRRHFWKNKEIVLATNDFGWITTRDLPPELTKNGDVQLGLIRKNEAMMMKGVRLRLRIRHALSFIPGLRFLRYTNIAICDSF